MASKWFEGLGAHAEGFLIATLLFRSKERDSFLNCLDIADAAVLRERANSVMELERSQRVNLLVAELKRLLALSSQPWLLAVDPSWIVELLKKEDPICQKAALGALPKTLASAVESSLPKTNGETAALTLSPSLSLAIRRAIEKQLTQMRAVSFDSTLDVSQLLLLMRSELELLILEMGKRGIAGAMSALGVEKSAHALEPVDKTIQAMLIENLKNVKPMTWLLPEESEARLKEIINVNTNLTKYFEDCGLWLIASLVVSEHHALQVEIAQRLDYFAGRKLLELIKTLKSKPEPPKPIRLDLEVFSLIIELAKERKIDERFSKCSLPK